MSSHRDPTRNTGKCRWVVPASAVAIGLAASVGLQLGDKPAASGMIPAPHDTACAAAASAPMSAL